MKEKSSSKKVDTRGIALASTFILIGLAILLALEMAGSRWELSYALIFVWVMCAFLPLAMGIMLFLTMAVKVQRSDAETDPRAFSLSSIFLKIGLALSFAFVAAASKWSLAGGVANQAVIAALFVCLFFGLGFLILGILINS